MATRKNKTTRCIKCNKEFSFPSYSKRVLCDECSPSKKVLTCLDCRKPFTFVGRTSRKRCLECAYNYKSTSVMKRRAAKNPAVKIGVGSGGNQWGISNHSWNPNSTYRGVGRVDSVEARGVCSMIWPKECVLCKDTTLVQAHHIDGNWRDNRPKNLIFLCKSCHKKLHQKTRIKTPGALIKSLFNLWPEGRIKIAEKIGNPETWESEVKAQLNNWTSHNDY